MTIDLITFLGQKVKVQGHTIAAEVHSTRRYRRVQLFLVYLCSQYKFTAFYVLQHFYFLLGAVPSIIVVSAVNLYSGIHCVLELFL